MKRQHLAIPAIATVLLLAGCAHPEDRRWASMEPRTIEARDNAPRAEVSVYAFIPPKPGGGKTGLRDLDGEGQAALIEAMASKPSDAAALRKNLAAPLGSDGGGAAADKSRLDRTIVISVRKPDDSEAGDRLMRTVVKIRPLAAPGGKSIFEFADYRIAATDTRIQNIASIETTSGASLSVGAEPGLGPLGAGSIGGELSRSHTTGADIVQQYENLGIDIRPDQLVITRESERGLDVMGNTLVELTLAPTAESEQVATGYLASETKFDDKGKPLSDAEAEMKLVSLRYMAQCRLDVEVTLDYRLRKIIAGREYYTEGKQTVEIVKASARPTVQTLVRATEVQPLLFHIENDNGWVLLASKTGTDSQPLLFDDFETAARFAGWLTATQSDRIGSQGPRISFQPGTPWQKAGKYVARYHEEQCGMDDPAQAPAAMSPVP